MAEDISVEVRAAGFSDVKEHELSSTDFVPEFNVVLVTNWKGEIIEARVEEPMQGFDPEAVSKAAAITAWVAKNTASMLGLENVQEIDIVMGDKLMVIMPESGGIRVGIMSAV